ncbi:hypothetical protein J3A83DRAFT_4369346 [Scleroderma citrinum]
MAQGQFTREEALIALNQHWNEGMAGDNHQEGGSKARDNCPERDGKANLQDQGGQIPPQAHPPQPDHKPSPANIPDLVAENPFNYNSKAQVASILLNHPADYALKCLENFKFVHM